MFRDTYTAIRNPVGIQTNIFCTPLKFTVRKHTGDLCPHSNFFKLMTSSEFIFCLEKLGDKWCRLTADVHLCRYNLFYYSPTHLVTLHQYLWFLQHMPGSFSHIIALHMPANFVTIDWKVNSMYLAYTKYILTHLLFVTPWGLTCILFNQNP